MTEIACVLHRMLTLDLKERGLKAGPLLAIGDGAMGFWAAVSEVYPETRHQRCCCALHFRGCLAPCNKVTLHHVHND